MLFSMTGFSNKTASINLKNGTCLVLTCMLKSLNARFIEINCKLPYALMSLETEFIKRIKHILVRGTVYLTIHVQNPQVLKMEIVPSNHIVGSYLKILRDLQKFYDLPGTITITELMHLPQVFETSELIADETISKEILDIIDGLTQNLQSIRAAEGSVLEEDIIKRLVVVEEILKNLKLKAVIVAQDRKEYMIQQLEAVIKNSISDIRDQQMQLLDLQLNRYDITEELTRSTAHIEKFSQVLNAACLEKGKKLDFILQELFREFNTICSKAARAEISDLAIDGKVELEKIREQVQNIL